MKDWKTYALVLLAAWCAYLTWRTSPLQIHIACHEADTSSYYGENADAEQAALAQALAKEKAASQNK